MAAFGARPRSASISTGLRPGTGIVPRCNAARSSSCRPPPAVHLVPANAGHGLGGWYVGERVYSHNSFFYALLATGGAPDDLDKLGHGA